MTEDTIDKVMEENTCHLHNKELLYEYIIYEEFQ